MQARARVHTRPVTETESSTDLEGTLAKLRAAFKKQGAPTHDQRIEQLTKLERALIAKKDELAEAIAADFGSRSKHESFIAEVFTTVGYIRYVKDHLREWMEPESAELSWLFAPSTAEILYQPIGVVGVIAPWNYPSQLVLVPLVSALAAGNRAMLKPSEVTPKTSAFLKTFLAALFDETQVAVVVGDVEVSKAFASLPFDHLFFTGSTRVGKDIMRAASANLVPVTLELGGKSPAIVGQGANIKEAADKIITGKLFNAGQTCIAPDYALVPKAALEEFIEAVKAATAKHYPSLANNPDYTSIVNDPHFDRLTGYLDEAKNSEARVIELNPANEKFEKEKRKFLPAIVVGAKEDSLVMTEEIFGPILPIVTYDTLDAAIAYVNDRPRPLSLYYFGHRRSDIDRVLNETIAGGVAINEVMLQFVQDSLPFGGVGASGFGNYHGRDGFVALSKKKPVYYQSRFGGGALLRPPYGKTFETLFRFVVGK